MHSMLKIAHCCRRIIRKRVFDAKRFWKFSCLE